MNPDLLLRAVHHPREESTLEASPLALHAALLAPGARVEVWSPNGRNRRAHQPTLLLAGAATVVPPTPTQPQRWHTEVTGPWELREDDTILCMGVRALRLESEVHLYPPQESPDS